VGCNGPVDTSTVLENGVAKGPLSGASKSGTVYTFEVPASATKATFKLTGGSGDADMYVRFDGTPTTRTYDCRSWESGNNESCSLDVTQAGTYQVLIDGYSAYSGASLVATHNGSDNGGQAPSNYSNQNAMAIPDNSALGATSEIDVLRSGDSGTVTVAVDISHSYVGDLNVTLTSPTGGQVVLHENTGGSANDIRTSFQANFTGFESKGNWKLKAVDSARQDTGTINSWSLSFQ
jgi:serine protease